VNSLGIGVIGCGRIAQSHLKSVDAHKHARAVAVVDVIPERAEETAKRFQIPKVCRSLDELLSLPEVDAVIVCTPPAAHTAPTLAALSAGKHVLCEKPFALDVGEAEQMTEAAEKAGRWLSVCSARARCGAAARKARELILDGAIGTPYHIRSTAFRQRGRPGIDFWQDATWFQDKSQAGGGALMDLGVYQIDLMLWLLGNPKVKSVLATTFQGVGAPPPPGVRQDVEDHVTAMMVLDNGASAVLEQGWSTNMAGADSLMVWGSKAGLRFRPLTMISEPMVDGHLTETRLLDVDDHDSTGHGDVTTAFINAVIEGREPLTPAREALQITKVIDAIYRSAASGTAVAP
jgi:predicted dehydrogenase